MKIHQIVPSIFNQSDGVANCVRHLSSALLTKGIEIHVHSLVDEGAIVDNLEITSYKHNRFPTVSIGRSVEMAHNLSHSITSNDIIHVHGLWMQPTVYAAHTAKKTGCKYCLEIHGTLSQWALNHSRFKKFISLYLLGQKAALTNADLLIATCEDEYNDIRNFGHHNPVAIIPNGVSIPTICNIKKTTPFKQMVFLSRIHKKKGVDILLKSWKALQDKHLDWELIIAGPLDNDFAQTMIEYNNALGCQRVRFTGQLKGPQITDFLSQAACFVLPTHSENFGIAVAEALACGTPAITTTGAPWEGINHHNCGKWINLSEQNLISALDDMMNLPIDTLSEMGQRGRNWISAEFSWDIIADQMDTAYRWLLNPQKEVLPSFIKID